MHEVVHFDIFEELLRAKLVLSTEAESSEWDKNWGLDKSSYNGKTKFNTCFIIYLRD